jgi:hypothetical protein
MGVAGPGWAGASGRDGVVVRCSGLVLGQDRRQVAVTEDQHSVGDLRPGARTVRRRRSRGMAAGRDHRGFDSRAGTPIPGRQSGERAGSRLARTLSVTVRGFTCPARKYDSAGDLQVIRASGSVCVLVDQAAQDRFSADPFAVDVRHSGAGSVMLADGNALRDALVRPGRVVVHLCTGPRRRADVAR